MSQTSSTSSSGPCHLLLLACKERLQLLLLLELLLVLQLLQGRGIARARYGILWERLWPPLAAFATVCGLFLVVS